MDRLGSPAGRPRVLPIALVAGLEARDARHRGDEARRQRAVTTDDDAVDPAAPDDDAAAASRLARVLRGRGLGRVGDAAALLQRQLGRVDRVTELRDRLACA